MITISIEEVLGAYGLGTSLRTMACGDDDYVMEAYDEAPEALQFAFNLGRDAQWSSRYGYEPFSECVVRVYDVESIEDVVDFEKFSEHEREILKGAMSA